MPNSKYVNDGKYKEFINIVTYIYDSENDDKFISGDSSPINLSKGRDTIDFR